jgi:DNA polymerase-3 subunit delta
LTRSANPRRASPGRKSPAPTAARAPRSGPAVYLLLGEEEWRAEEALRRLLDELLPPAERDLNLDVVDVGDVSVQDIITRCETLPFFGARRVVVVRRAEAMRAADQDMLAAYLERGTPPSVLIVQAAKLDARRRLFQTLKHLGRLEPCDPLKPWEVSRWIRARAQKAGKALAPDAVELLAQLVGDSMRELATEIDKLVAYVGDRPTVTAGDIRSITSHVAEAEVFELMDAVGHQQAGRALKLLRAVLAKEPALLILFMLGDHIRTIRKAKVLVERRASAEEARGVLGGRYWLYRDGKLQPQVSAFAHMDMARVLGLLLEADTDIKTGVKPPRLALETLIVGLCGV